MSDVSYKIEMVESLKQQWQADVQKKKSEKLQSMNNSKDTISPEISAEVSQLERENPIGETPGA